MNLDRDLYQEHIIELYKNPKNFGKLEKKTHSSRGVNTFCGDDISFDLIVEDQKITDTKFHGKACAICTASASLLSDKIKDRTIQEIKEMNSKTVRDLLGVELGPARIKCALLPLDVVKKALGEKNVKS